jgi:predicted aspartyl protease
MFRFIAGLTAALSFAASSSACAQAQSAAPIVFDAEGRPSAQVRLNDEADFLFAVDTAAQRTGLGAPVLERLALEPNPEEVAQLHGAAGVVTVPMYPLASVEAGGRRIEDGLYLSLTGAHDRGGHAHDGILGQDVFMGAGRIAFDFNAMIMRFGGETRPGGAPAELMYGGFALVDIAIDGVATRALIDTGAARSFGNPALRAALGHNGLAARSEIRGVSQDALQLQTGRVEAIRLGRTGVHGVDLDFADSPVFRTFRLTDRPAVVLGMDVLGCLSGLTVDYEAGQVRFGAD